MKVLVLVEDYPNLQNGHNLMYVHTRNAYYVKKGIIVDTLNFSAKQCYDIDGVHVISYDYYKKTKEKYDLLILHAANIRHHYVFLKKYGKYFNRLMFFYHGHEVLKINSVYPKPYPYIKVNDFKNKFQDFYDCIKLYIWKKYLPKIVEKSSFVFVSNWMKEEFEKWTKISLKEINAKYVITYNCVGSVFEKESYDDVSLKKYDFVTIRGNLDVSKYSIDIVNELAKKSPKSKFLVVGKGDFFKHYEKANNIEWWDKTLNHYEIIKVLNDSRFALMPTRTDAQGLMMCEMAAFGIPVITSDIPVCHEIFDGFSNAYFINNSSIQSLDDFINKDSLCKKDSRYFFDNTVSKEYLLIDSSLSGVRD